MDDAVYMQMLSRLDLPMPLIHTLLVLLTFRFSEWPSDALKSVSARFLNDVDMGSDNTRTAVEDMCVVFHQVSSVIMLL
jgi:hypothetical protein